MPATSEVTVYLGENIIMPGLRSKKCRKVVRASQVSSLLTATPQHLFLICRATLIGQVTPLVLEHRDNLRGLLVLQDVDLSFVTPLLHRAKLKNLRNLVVHGQDGLYDKVSRILAAWEANAASKLIADASVAGDQLLVRSCDFSLYEIPFESVKALAGLDAIRREQFKIASDGSYLHWEIGDIHLDLDSLRYGADPELRAKKDRERLLHDKRFGATVAAVRRIHGLTQASFPGLSEREMRRIEKGETLPRSATLAILAKAHGMSLSDYLSVLRLNTLPTRRAPTGFN